MTVILKCISDQAKQTCFWTLSLCITDVTDAEQSGPISYVSINKHEINFNKECFCRPANVGLSFWNPFSDQTAQAFSSIQIYNVLI